MVTQIILHILPHEIDWFEWQAKQLKIGNIYIEDKVIIDATLNLNLVNWNESKLSKQFFIDKFLQIKELLHEYELLFDINKDGTCLGINDKRRDSIRKYTPDNFIYLDYLMSRNINLRDNNLNTVLSVCISNILENNKFDILQRLIEYGICISNSNILYEYITTIHDNIIVYEHEDIDNDFVNDNEDEPTYNKILSTSKGLFISSS